MLDDDGPDIQEQLLQDPYPLYDQWRSTDPVLWIDPIQHWFVTGHQEAMAALRDPGVTGSSPGGTARHRAELRRAFTTDFTEQFQSQFSDLAEARLAKLAEQGTVELIGDVASPLAISMVAGLLGVPASCEETLRAWTAEVSPTLTPSLGHCGRQPGEDPLTVPDTVRQVLEDTIADRLADPQDDLLGRLRDLDPGELVDLCGELVISAHDSTTGLLGNAVAALLDNPGRLARLHDQPSLIPSAVEEFLRYDAPVQIIARTSGQDLDLCGKKVSAGQPILVFVGAANRDPEAFDDPGELNLSRTPNHHLSFGRGARVCLGAPLARLAGRIVIGALAADYPELEVAGTPTRRVATGARGFLTFPVALRS